MKPSRQSVLTVTFFVLLATAASCKSRSSTPMQPEDYRGMSSVPAEGEPVDGDWIVRNLTSNPPSLNPIIANDTSSGAVLSFLFESLIDRDLKTLEYKPTLAESWTVSPDGQTYTFKIRQGVRFHDGNPMTIEDVVFSYERIMDPEVDAAETRSYFSQVDYLKQTGPDTFECRFKEPHFKALEICGGFVPILPKHIYGKATGKEFNTQPANETPVGTGPLRFVDWKRGESLTLARFSDYWGPKEDRLHLDRMVFLFIADPEAEFISFTKGNLDAVSIRPEVWFREAATPEFRAKNHRLEYDFPAYSYIGWNSRLPMFADAKTRVALHHLIDREKIAQQIWRGLARPINSTEFDKSPYWNPDLPERKYDPQAAASLLKEAGWADTNGDGLLDRDGKPFEFTIIISQGSPEGEQTVTYYQDTLKRAGIKMNISILDWANLLKKLDKRDYEAAMLGWALSPDPDYYQLWHSSQADIEGGSNYVGFRSALVDELILKNRKELDREKRIPLIREMQKVIYDEAPYLFLFSRKATIAASNRYRNIHFYTPRPCVDYREWFVPKNLQKYTAVAP